MVALNEKRWFILKEDMRQLNDVISCLQHCSMPNQHWVKDHYSLDLSINKDHLTSNMSKLGHMGTPNSLSARLTIVLVSDICFWNRFSTLSRWHSLLSLPVTKSSVYPLVFSKYLIKEWIIFWNVAGEFFIQNGRTLYLYSLEDVGKAEISLALSVKGAHQLLFSWSVHMSVMVNVGHVMLSLFSWFGLLFLSSLSSNLNLISCFTLKVCLVLVVFWVTSFCSSPWLFAPVPPLFPG